MRDGHSVRLAARPDFAGLAAASAAGRLAGRAAWALTGLVTWQLVRHDDTLLRRRLGLRGLPARGPVAAGTEAMPVYYAYNPVVLSRPADWPERMHVTGYWFLGPPPSWQPRPD